MLQCESSIGLINYVGKNVYLNSHIKSVCTKSVFQVAKAFWMAIGGDDDEIDGLSSGEES